MKKLFGPIALIIIAIAVLIFAVPPPSSSPVHREQAVAPREDLFFGGDQIRCPKISDGSPRVKSGLFLAYIEEETEFVSEEDEWTGVQIAKSAPSIRIELVSFEKPLYDPAISGDIFDAYDQLGRSAEELKKIPREVEWRPGSYRVAVTSAEERQELDLEVPVVEKRVTILRLSRRGSLEYSQSGVERYDFRGSDESYGQAGDWYYSFKTTPWHYFSYIDPYYSKEVMVEAEKGGVLMMPETSAFYLPPGSLSQPTLFAARRYEQPGWSSQLVWFEPTVDFQTPGYLSVKITDFSREQVITSFLERGWRFGLLEKETSNLDFAEYEIRFGKSRVGPVATDPDTNTICVRADHS